MTNYVGLDMTFADITSAILTEYKEPVTGSSAVPLDYVEDMVNLVYFDIFNKPELRSYKKESDHTFQSEDNQQVGTGGVLASAITLVLDDSSGWPATGTGCINKSDFFAYTANDLSLTLSGVTGIQVDHDEGEKVEIGYALPSDIDAQLIKTVSVGGLPYVYVPPSDYFSNANLTYRAYTIFEEKMYISPIDSSVVTVFYECTLTALTGTNKPTMIPGKFRPSLLISGTIARIGIRDDLRTGFQQHQQMYEFALARFIAEQNNPIKGEHPSRRPSVYD